MNSASAPGVHPRVPAQPLPHTMVRNVLLVCGIASSLLYVAMNIIVPMQYEGYSSVSQTVSELSAIGAPTRPLWSVLGALYVLLFAAFGCGVWISGSNNRPLRIAGGLFVLYSLISLFWPPMHQRGAEITLTDTLHIVWTSVWGLFMLLGMGYAAAGLGKRFRWYSIATTVVLLGCGFMTGLEAPNIQKNLPTPWIGVWERINIGAFMLWAVVLAIALLRTKPNEEEQQ